MFTNSYQRIFSTENLMVAHAFFSSCFFINPILTKFYQNELSLEIQDFFTIIAYMGVLIVLFELPTGWAADRWGRKNAMMAGTFLMVCGFMTLLFVQGFWPVVAAQTMTSAGISFISGAGSALLYDTFVLQEKKGLYRRYEGYKTTASLIAMAGSSILGGWIYTNAPHMPLILTIMASLIALTA